MFEEDLEMALAEEEYQDWCSTPLYYEDDDPQYIMCAESPWVSCEDLKRVRKKLEGN